MLAWCLILEYYVAIQPTYICSSESVDAIVSRKLEAIYYKKEVENKPKGRQFLLIIGACHVLLHFPFPSLTLTSI